MFVKFSRCRLNLVYSNFVIPSAQKPGESEIKSKKKREIERVREKDREIVREVDKRGRMTKRETEINKNKERCNPAGIRTI